MDQLDGNKGDVSMNDLLINIDGKATQTPQITAKYTLEIPNFSNVKSSAVEEAAVKSADFFRDQSKFFKWFNRGLTRLTTIERQLMSLCYLEEEPMYNYEIFTELNISERKFYRLKSKALEFCTAHSG